MRLRIFKEARKIYEEGKVKELGMARDSTFFKVCKEVEVSIEISGNKTVVKNCTCMHHSVNPNDQGLLCAYSLACCIYLSEKQEAKWLKKYLDSKIEYLEVGQRKKWQV